MLKTRNAKDYALPAQVFASSTLPSAFSFSLETRTKKKKKKKKKPTKNLCTKHITPEVKTAGSNKIKTTCSCTFEVQLA